MKDKTKPSKKKSAKRFIRAAAELCRRQSTATSNQEKRKQRVHEGEKRTVKTRKTELKKTKTVKNKINPGKNI